jgi:hypothetical protein
MPNIVAIAKRILPYPISEHNLSVQFISDKINELQTKVDQLNNETPGENESHHFIDSFATVLWDSYRKYIDRLNMQVNNIAISIENAIKTVEKDMEISAKTPEITFEFAIECVLCKLPMFVAKTFTKLEHSDVYELLTNSTITVCSNVLVFDVIDSGYSVSVHSTIETPINLSAVLGQNVILDRLTNYIEAFRLYYPKFERIRNNKIAKMIDVVNQQDHAYRLNWFRKVKHNEVFMWDFLWTYSIKELRLTQDELKGYVKFMSNMDSHLVYTKDSFIKRFGESRYILYKLYHSCVLPMKERVLICIFTSDDPRD